MNIHIPLLLIHVVEGIAITLGVIFAIFGAFAFKSLTGSRYYW